VINNLIYYKLNKGRAVFTGDKADVFKKMKEIPEGDIMVALEDIDIPDDTTDLLGFADNISNCLDVGCSAEMKVTADSGYDNGDTVNVTVKCGDYYGEDQFWCDDCIDLSDKVLEIKQ